VDPPCTRWGEQALAQLFGSEVRAKIIAWLCTHAKGPVIGRELARSLGVSQMAVSKELRRLRDLGLLRADDPIGRAKPYHLDERFPLLSGLRSMVLYATGVVVTLQERLRDEPHIDIAFVYGSVALGADHPASDVDVIVVGSISGRRLASLVREVELATRRPINEVHYSGEEFRTRAQETGGFLLGGARVFVKEDEDVLRELAQ
jgi:DNA-binding transcriptional ArsR family regulator